jgi:hypothetical protein
VLFNKDGILFAPQKHDGSEKYFPMAGGCGWFDGSRANRFSGKLNKETDN